MERDAAGIDGMHDDIGDINISDVIEVIETTDPGFTSNTTTTANMLSMTGGGLTSSGRSASSSTTSNIYVEIVEQPASKAMRFRYECEGRSAGSIPGANSTPENKTFPTIRVVGYQGKAVVVVSCVTKDQPYRPHPHNLVGKENCRRGVCTVEIPVEGMSVTFSNLGIRCVKKKDIEGALREREEIKVDPYRTGFAHRNQPSSIDLNAVRLCFQVFLQRDKTYKIALPPVVSEPIFDKKAMSDLAIFQMSADSSSVAGGKKILLFCEKVTKEDIQVRFYEEKDGLLKWEGFADFQPADVHRQVGIAFRTPKYHTLEVTDPVKVNIQLMRPSDKACSDALPFLLTPLEKEADMKRKRQRFGSEHPNNYLRVSHLQNQATSSAPQKGFNAFLNITADPIIKLEPRDISPQTGNKMFGGGLSPMYSPGGAESMQYRMPPSVSPGKSPAPMDIQNENIYSPASYPQGLNIIVPSPSGSITPSNTMDDFQANAMLEQQHWNIPPKNYNQEQWNIRQQSTFPQEQWNENNSSYPLLNMLDQPLNIFGGASVAVPAGTLNNLDSAPVGLSSVLDLDSQELTQLNSADLADGLNVFDHQLSENLSNHLSLTENRPQENMTDSLTRITVSTINEICNLNAMCNGEKR